jgi:hypothetical protein
LESSGCTVSELVKSFLLPNRTDIKQRIQQ